MNKKLCQNWKSQTVISIHKDLFLTGYSDYSEKCISSPWLACQHQIALNFLVSLFIFREKLELSEEIPLLSTKDVKEMLVRELIEQMTLDQMLN